ncbi:mCG60009 [Mus musculus]|nr:mCG60009 [Mus musculus]
MKKLPQASATPAGAVRLEWPSVVTPMVMLSGKSQAPPARDRKASDKPEKRQSLELEFLSSNPSYSTRQLCDLG